MENTEPKQSKLKILSMVLTLFFLVALVAGLTFAIFQFSDLGDEENSVTTGTLVMDIDEEGANSIELQGQYPVSDEEGLEGPAYTFTVRNNGTLSAKYRLRLVKDEALYSDFAKADASHIKYSFQVGESEPTIQILGNDEVILEDNKTLAKDGSQTYTIRVWIDSDEDIENTFFDEHTIEFHGHVELDAIQDGHTNYTTGE